MRLGWLSSWPFCIFGERYTESPWVGIGEDCAVKIAHLAPICPHQTDLRPDTTLTAFHQLDLTESLGPAVEVMLVLL
jgi:hypothetical protein